MNYKSQGWIHIPDFIPKENIAPLRRILIKTRRLNKSGGFKGVQCAARQYPELWDYYCSDYMYNLASTLLETETPYIFNDQTVVKLPFDNFTFESHYDNQYRTPDGIETVNCCLILDDFTKENGTLELFNSDTQEWVTIYPSAGDVVAINGETYHMSGPNNSEEPRALYACVYAKEQINFENFYREVFPDDYRHQGSY